MKEPLCDCENCNAMCPEDELAHCERCQQEMCPDCGNGDWHHDCEEAT